MYGSYRGNGDNMMNKTKIEIVGGLSTKKGICGVCKDPIELGIGVVEVNGGKPIHIECLPEEIAVILEGLPDDVWGDDE